MFEIPEKGLDDLFPQLPASARPKHLAYVEWFTPFRRPDPITGYYHLARSTRQGQPNAEIISVDRIVRNCMLVPRKKDEKQYVFNHHIDGHMFCTAKLDYKGCFPRSNNGLTEHELEREGAG